MLLHHFALKMRKGVKETDEAEETEETDSKYSYS